MNKTERVTFNPGSTNTNEGQLYIIIQEQPEQNRAIAYHIKGQFGDLHKTKQIPRAFTIFRFIVLQLLVV